MSHINLIRSIATPYARRMRWLILITLIAAAAACRRGQPPARAEPDPPPMIFTDQDREMNAAMVEGHRTVPVFLAALRQPPPGSTGFAIKATFRDGAQVEHMWLHETQLNGDKLDGVLANDPVYVKGFTNGQRVAVGRDQIVDWSYIKDGVLVGGHTLRVMFSRVPAAEREALQQELGYRLQ
jgi:uncharacterized protein YegJ (DUF2314 family)